MVGVRRTYDLVVVLDGELPLYPTVASSDDIRVSHPPTYLPLRAAAGGRGALGAGDRHHALGHYAGGKRFASSSYTDAISRVFG